MMRTELKAQIIEYFESRDEIASMDDELPLIILVILHCQILDCYA